MRTEHIRTASITVFSGIVLIAGFALIRQSSRLHNYEQQHARDVATIAQLRSALGRQSVQSPVAGASQPGRVPARGCASDSEGDDLAAADAATQNLTGELNQARASLARLQAQLDAAERDKQAASAAAESLRVAEQDWRNRLDSVQQQLDSARAEAEGARTARDRASALEAENAKYRNDNGAATARAADMRKAFSNLLDLDRRRDAYLNSVLRRYRDLTDQFRAMTGVIESSRTPGNSSSFNDAALSRIQNVTSLAEDDLRRVNDLSAQARQLENRLAKN